jgi:glucose uptake protein GlcU
MNIFLDSPRYEWGIFGFFTNPSVGKRALQIAGVASSVTLVSALGVYAFGNLEPKVPAQMVFLVASAWLGVFGMFRIFATVAMKVFEAVTSLVEDAIPGLAGPLHYLIRAY